MERTCCSCEVSSGLQMPSVAHAPHSHTYTKEVIQISKYKNFNGKLEAAEQKNSSCDVRDHGRWAFSCIVQRHWNPTRRKLSYVIDTQFTNNLESTVLENVWEEKADGKGVGRSNCTFDLFLHLPCNLSNYFIRLESEICWNSENETAMTVRWLPVAELT